MSGEQKPPIVIKRIKRSHGGHHGGAWKIAYADFVTAMMAFFLLMWLLGSTTKADLNGISEYFKTPLKVALAGGSGSGDSSSVIQGGGTDLTRTVGQVKRGELASPNKIISLKAARAELERVERLRLGEVKSKLEQAMNAKASLQAIRNQVRIDMTQDGLRIQVVDEQNRPMFDSGRAVLKDYTRDLLREIASALNDLPNRISLSGHTDAAPYALGERGYSNWELSADRANASRRELIAGGITENKIMRVVGLGASVPLDAADPHNPVNRRISIVVLNQRAEERILEDGVPRVREGEATAEAGVPSAAKVAATAGETPAKVAAATPQGTDHGTGPAPAAVPHVPAANAAASAATLAQAATQAAAGAQRTTTVAAATPAAGH